MDKGKIKKKRKGGTVYVKRPNGEFTKFKKRTTDSDGNVMIRTRVDKDGNAHYRPAKEPRMKEVKKSPAYNSKKGKVTRRKWKMGYAG